MTPHEIDLHIDALILHGFAPGDRPLIAQALQQELTRLLTEQGVPSSLTHSIEVPHLQGANVQAASGLSPRAIGTQVAQSIYTSLG